MGSRMVASAGLITLTLGACLAIFQQDMKGVLAYSTISHLGLITLLFGFGPVVGLVASAIYAIPPMVRNTMLVGTVNANGSVVVGDEKNCVVTNKTNLGTLTLVKVVDNAGTGATAEATDWTLEADGPDDAHDLSGAGGDSGAAVVGDYALSETGGPAGYDPSAWTCTKAAGQGSVPVTVTDGTVTVGLGDDVTCTITNTRKPQVKVVKELVPGERPLYVDDFTKDNVGDVGKRFEN